MQVTLPDARRDLESSEKTPDRVRIAHECDRVDFFHWPKEGEWKFATTYWPNLAATVDLQSENYQEMLTEGLLIRQDRGLSPIFEGNTSCTHFDATNPAARSYVWNKVKANYYDKGVRVLWLDKTEPEYTLNNFDNYRYHKGPNLMVGNILPRYYSPAVYDGMRAAGQDKVVKLVRCAWAGCQKYGALLWSSDIASSWSSFRDQLAAGLNAGLAGISWWTTDIGGFHGGNLDDPDFGSLPSAGSSGVPSARSSACTAIGNRVNRSMAIREAVGALLAATMRDYIRAVVHQAHVNGDPVIHPLFYGFPHDKQASDVENQYSFGDKILVAPVLTAGQRKMRVYVPAGAQWKQLDEIGETIGDVVSGGASISIDCPLQYMPVFERID